MSHDFVTHALTTPLRRHRTNPILFLHESVQTATMQLAKGNAYSE